MDLSSVFENSCLYSEKDNVKTWRIEGETPSNINKFKNWLISELESTSIDHLTVYANNSGTHDEVIFHRLELVPLKGITPTTFTLRKRNFSNDIVYVMSDELEPKGIAMEGLVLFIMLPGSVVDLEATSSIGKGKSHAKWSSVWTTFGTVTHVKNTNPDCSACKVDVNQGIGCYYLTIELLGSLTFEDIQEQLDRR